MTGQIDFDGNLNFEVRELYFNGVVDRFRLLVIFRIFLVRLCVFGGGERRGRELKWLGWVG